MTPLELAADAARRLDRLGIPYVIRGSLASALVGEPRSTADVDIAVELTADRQWRDVLGVLRTQAGRMDDGYLDTTAREAGLSDLLARARRDARDES